VTIPRASSRRAVRRLLLAAGALVAVVTLGTGGLVAAWLAGVRVPLASGQTALTIQKVGNAEGATAPDQPFFVLLVGSDARPGVGGARGDALHVVGVNPSTRSATILNIPRDVCTRVPGAGYTKINSALSQGGARGQADVVGALIGRPIPYVAALDFAGFVQVVDTIGGVTVDVPVAMDDRYSGAVFTAGRQRMNGGQALAFGRNRKQFANGDITRTANQGVFLLGALQTLQAEARGAAGQFRVASLLGRHAALEGVGLRELWNMGRAAMRLDPARVRNVTMPVGYGGCAGGLVAGGGAESLFADFVDDAVLQAH